MAPDEEVWQVWRGKDLPDTRDVDSNWLDARIERRAVSRTPDSGQMTSCDVLQQGSTEQAENRVVGVAEKDNESSAESGAYTAAAAAASMNNLAITDDATTEDATIEEADTENAADPSNVASSPKSRWINIGTWHRYSDHKKLLKAVSTLFADFTDVCYDADGFTETESQQDARGRDSGRRLFILLQFPSPEDAKRAVEHAQGKTVLSVQVVAKVTNP